MRIPFLDRIRDRRRYHPDLRLASVVLPPRLVGPLTLPAVQKIGTLLPGLRGTETHELDSGATVRVFRPPGDQSSPSAGLVWIHGGGYVVGSAAQDDVLCRALARSTGATVVSVDYRLAPQHPFPAALDDCHAALG